MLNRESGTGYIKPSMEMFFNKLDENKKTLALLANQFQQIKSAINPDSTPLLPLVDTDYCALKKSKEQDAIERFNRDPLYFLLDPVLLFDKVSTQPHFINREISDITQRTREKIQAHENEFVNLNLKLKSSIACENLCDISMYIVRNLYQALSQVKGEIQWQLFIMTTTRMKASSQEVSAQDFNVEASNILMQKMHEHGFGLDVILSQYITSMQSLQSELAVRFKLALSSESTLKRNDKKDSLSTRAIARSLGVLDISALALPKEGVLVSIASEEKDVTSKGLQALSRAEEVVLPVFRSY